MTAEELIAKIATYCNTFAWMAGVGGCETAGAVVSYLAAHPEHTSVFMEGGVCALMDAAGDARHLHANGCLTFHRQKDGKVTTPQELRIAVTVRNMVKGAQK